MKEGDLVALLIDLPARQLAAGDVGTIAYIYQNGAGYEVEFVNANGDTIAVETLKADQVKGVTSSEVILHIRLDTAA
ncbi:DUF4926 domain-containing protein [Larkinella sp. VNQ87]|uniref:DUF4926 domain-containing protein n=1 Tax=Larkinella sp. VNQ87 TaxID=3400921 RepID=UPI003C04D6EC